MNFQIMDIVLYGKNGHKKEISFDLGELNIITGLSKTGKTALLEIIDYCFCSDSCNIPEGIMRRTLSWVGIHLKITEGELFIARKMPEKNADISTKAYYTLQNKVIIPECEDLHPNENIIALKTILSNHLGIKENLHDPPEGQTRKPLVANIKHSLAFNIQHQNEIDDSKHLFHKQSDSFVPQAIKDTFPYFLGAVNDDYVDKKEQLRQLNSNLRKLKVRLREIEAINGNGISRAQNLLIEAENLGFNIEIQENMFDSIKILKKILIQPINEENITIADGAFFDKLQTDRRILREELTLINMQLEEAKIVSSERSGYAREVTAHINRLKSVELFEENEDLKSCPICNSRISEDLPTIENLKNSINTLEKQIPLSENPSPYLQKAKRNLISKRENIKNKLKENQYQLDSLGKSNEKIKEFKEFNSKKAYLFGKIDLYLESLPLLPNNKSLIEEIDNLELKIKDLNDEIKSENTQERLESILFIISKYMGEFATELNLEHSKYPLRLDMKNLTVIADTPDGPYPLKAMGSGENWVGYHLITLFALHKWFLERNCPVPQFLFIDQPSKGHFPADDADENMETNNDDRDVVKRIYKFICKFVEEFHPKFQVIATDHAYLKNEKWFTERVIQRWNGEEALIPEWWDE